MKKKSGRPAIGSGAQDRLIVITGAGGFIGGALVRYFHGKNSAQIRAVDKKPLPEWYQRVPGVESLCLDVSIEENCVRACAGATEVYNLAADMGGMGFIEKFRIECLRSVLINTHMIEAPAVPGPNGTSSLRPPAPTTSSCRKTPTPEL
jgi:GDP-D-mannose 3', 5'-epimerase